MDDSCLSKDGVCRLRLTSNHRGGGGARLSTRLGLLFDPWNSKSANLPVNALFVRGTPSVPSHLHHIGFITFGVSMHWLRLHHP